MKTRGVRLAPAEVEVERRASGEVLLRSPRALEAYPAKLTEELERWAARVPERVLFAQRDATGGWRRLTYGQALERTRRIAAGLLARGLSAERPVAILSGNDIEHALLALGSMYAGIAYAPISPAYSLLSTDYGKLKSIMALLTPGLVFASQNAFSKAIQSTVPSGVEVAFDLTGIESPDAETAKAAHGRITPDTIAKFLFTSGSTGEPKAVINTQRMWCSNQQMVRQVLQWVNDEPPVMVDWAPWHHTAGGNKDFGMVVFNGGTMYIDEGKPLPGAIDATVRNLAEVPTNWYFTVPKGYDMLLPHLRQNAALRKTFFSRLKALWFAGAGVSQPVFDEYKKLAHETCGEHVLFLTGLGATETAPFAFARTWDSADATNMGLPPPGAEVKLVKHQEKYEARVKGPHITPGYWRQPELTRAAFDEDGFYRLGDAFVFEDLEKPARGLLFRGRIAEDFKLSTGTWVHVGPLRAEFLNHFAPLARDVVIAGENRPELGVLVFPAGSFSRQEFLDRLKSMPSTGSSNRIARMIVLDEPPSLDSGEMTDKGSINQKAVLGRRAALVEELYAEPASSRVLFAANATK